jgi:hypothetical protein
MNSNIFGGAMTATNVGLSTGTIGATTQQYSSPPTPWSNPKKSYSVGFQIEEAENGYVLRYAYNEGEYTRTKIAKDMEEVRDLVTSILVERKLGI